MPEKDMADMVTKQELEAAKVDVKNAGEAVNEEKVVKTRLGRSFKSIPLIVKEGEAKITQAAQTITSATASIVAQKNQASAAISEAESDVSMAAASVHQRGNQEIANLQNAIDIAAAAGAGENGWTAQLIADASGKSQQEINNAITKTFEYFNNDFIAAGEWLKESTANYVEIDASAYTLPTGAVYFNRYTCKKGRVKINVPASTNLKYGAFATDEVLHLEGINFYIEDHRMGVDSTGYQTVYTDLLSNTVCKTSKIKDVNVYGMKDGSYVDDTGRTRCCGFINYRVSESSEIQNIKTFGVRVFADVSAIGTVATHNDSNIICVNAETGIYYSPSTWLSGKISNAKIINTAEQKTYYIGMNTGLASNGKDVIMNAANYTIPLEISDIYAEHAIERSIYVQSKKAIVSKITDKYSYSAAHVKTTPNEAKIGEASLSGIHAVDTSNAGNKLQTYGLLKYELSDCSYIDSAKSNSRFLVFTNVGEISIKDLYVKNTSTLFYMAGSTATSSKLSVSDAQFDNVYSAVVPYIYDRQNSTTNDALHTLRLTDIKHTVDFNTAAPADLHHVAIDALGISNTIISDSSFVVGQALHNNISNYVELNNVNITVYTTNVLATAFSNLNLGGQNGLNANIFDVNIQLKSTALSTSDIYANIHCKKMSNTGVVFCANHWDQIDLEIPVGTTQRDLYLLPLGTASYKMEVSFAGSTLEAAFDATTGVLTQKAVAGDKLAVGARNDTKITFSVVTASANRFDVSIGKDSWTGGAGYLKIKLIRA